MHLMDFSGIHLGLEHFDLIMRMQDESLMGLDQGLNRILHNDLLEKEGDDRVGRHWSYLEKRNRLRYLMVDLGWMFEKG